MLNRRSCYDQGSVYWIAVRGYIFVQSCNDRIDTGRARCRCILQFVNMSRSEVRGRHLLL